MWEVHLQKANTLTEPTSFTFSFDVSASSFKRNHCDKCNGLASLKQQTFGCATFAMHIQQMQHALSKIMCMCKGHCSNRCTVPCAFKDDIPHF